MELRRRKVNKKGESEEANSVMDSRGGGGRENMRKSKGKSKKKDINTTTNNVDVLMLVLMNGFCNIGDVMSLGQTCKTYNTQCMKLLPALIEAWNECVTVLDNMNSSNLCDQCECVATLWPLAADKCSCSSEEEELGIDVRNDKKFVNMGSMQRAHSLAAYTGSQIRNLNTYFDWEYLTSIKQGDDWKKNDPTNVTSWEWDSQVINTFMKEQPQRYVFAVTVASLVLARNELEGGPGLYWHKDIFRGQGRWEPCTGSSYSRAFSDIFIGQLMPFNDSKFREALMPYKFIYKVLGAELARQVDVLKEVREIFQGKSEKYHLELEPLAEGDKRYMDEELFG